MKKFFAKLWAQVKRVPWWGWLTAVILYGLNVGIYQAAKAIIPIWSESWKVIPITQGIDTAIPLIPYYFAEVYFLWYPLVFIGPLAASSINREHFINLSLSWVAAQLIGFIVFICCPSYMDRTNVAGVGNMVELVKSKQGFSWWLMKIIVNSDGVRDNYNLFPSFHCLMATFCYLGLSRRKEIKIGYRVFWLIFTISVCLATFIIKQHYIFDTFTGVLLAVSMFALFKVLNPAKAILKRKPNFLIIKKINWTNEKIVK